MLKPPHSKRWRDCHASPNLAKRLECGAFTAAFARAARPRTNDKPRPRERARGLAHSKTLARMAMAPVCAKHLGVESACRVVQAKRVKATTKRQPKTEAGLLDHATSNLLRALKQDMLKKQGRVNCDKLRKEGYSERLLARLEQA